MIGIAHVILHISLCPRYANAPPSTPIEVRLHLADMTGRETIDKDFHFERGDTISHTVEFDAPRGTFRAAMWTPKLECNYLDFWSFIADQQRNMTAPMIDQTPTVSPIILLEGTAPQSFLSADPQFALFPKSTACDKPVGDPIPVQAKLENDGSSFYVEMPLQPALQYLFAFQVQTPTGEDHYVRMRMPLHPWDGFPITVTFNVSEDALGWLSTQPLDELLCPKVYWTSTG